MPLEAASGYCTAYDCAGYGLPPQAPHLWNQHDGARHYSDPEGWAEHVANCRTCKEADG